MKRSSYIALMVIGGAAALSGCGKDVDTAVYSSVEDCQAAGNPANQCRVDFEVAKRQHQNVAPKFKSKEDCEDTFGKDRCEDTGAQAQNSTAHSGGSGHFFIPYMAGYMMGGGRGNDTVAAQPLYREMRSGRLGDFRTAENSVVSSRTGPVRVNSWSSSAKAPSIKTTTVSRGGFGVRAVHIAS